MSGEHLISTVANTLAAAHSTYNGYNAQPAALYSYMANALESAQLLQSPQTAKRQAELEQMEEALLALLPTEPRPDLGLPNDLAQDRGYWGAMESVADVLGVKLPYARPVDEDPIAYALTPKAEESPDTLTKLFAPTQTLRQESAGDETTEEKDTREGESTPQLVGRLAEITTRHRNATEGPWWFDESEDCWRLHGVMLRGELGNVMNKQILKAPKHGTPYAEYWPESADAEFIANAWADIEFLLDELSRARISTGMPQLTGRLAQLLDAIRTHRGRWSTEKTRQLYRALGVPSPTRAQVRHDLRDLHRMGHLVLHEEKGRRFYTLNSRKDGRP